MEASGCPKIFNDPEKKTGLEPWCCVVLRLVMSDVGLFWVGKAKKWLIIVSRFSR